MNVEIIQAKLRNKFRDLKKSSITTTTQTKAFIKHAHFLDKAKNISMCVCVRVVKKWNTEFSGSDVPPKFPILFAPQECLEFVWLIHLSADDGLLSIRLEEAADLESKKLTAGQNGVDR